MLRFAPRPLDLSRPQHFQDLGRSVLRTYQPEDPDSISINLGVLIPDHDIIRRVRDLCRRYGTLSTADEVARGLGRTGRLFAFEHFDLDPNMIFVAKAMSGGLAAACTQAARSRRCVGLRRFFAGPRSGCVCRGRGPPPSAADDCFRPRAKRSCGSSLTPRCAYFFFHVKRMSSPFRAAGKAAGHAAAASAPACRARRHTMAP